MTDTPLVHLNATEAAIARANGHTVYSFNPGVQEYSTLDWNKPVTPPKPQAASVLFGINGTSLLWGNTASNANSMAQMQSLGITHFRTNIPWNFSQGHWTSLYQSDGKTFDPNSFAAINALTTQAKPYGLTPIFVIDGLVAAPGTYPTNPQYNARYPVTPQDFALACAQLVKECPGIHWELINEPNYYGASSGTQLLTPSVYVEALKLAYPAMKAADPSCVVHLGPVSDLTSGGSGYNWLAAIYALGTVGFFDVFSCHLYTWRANRTWQMSDQGALDAQIKAVNVLRAKYGDTSPLWLTETGWKSVTTNSGDTDPEMTPALQATYLVSWLQRIETMYPAIDAAFVYNLQDYNGGNWGLVEIDDVTEKPSFSAVQALIKG